MFLGQDEQNSMLSWLGRDILLETACLKGQVLFKRVLRSIEGFLANSTEQIGLLCRLIGCLLFSARIFVSFLSFHYIYIKKMFRRQKLKALNEFKLTWPEQFYINTQSFLKPWLITILMP